MKRIGTILWCAVGVCVLICATACSESDDDRIEQGMFAKNYVFGYMIPSSLEFHMIDWSSVPYTVVHINGGYADEAQREALREKYNDLSYNKAIAVPMFALYDGISGLSAETVDYFDEAHPAGSDVSDIVVCKYLTCYEFIQSGYVAIEKDYNLYPPLYGKESEGTLQHETALSEINYNDSQLMVPEMIFEFTSEPEEPGTYEFKFHFKMPEVEINTTFEYDFQ